MFILKLKYKQGLAKWKDIKWSLQGTKHAYEIQGEGIMSTD